jgi:multidrug efflux pump subunit AcrA (membrane-fusion protein)
VTRKFFAGVSIAVVGFFAVATGDYRVTAKIIIEGQVQRVITSPFPAYLAEASARAGDIVRAGQALALLDDKDIKVEHIKALSQRDQLMRQYRQAMAKHDRAQAGISMAQLAQVEAQLELFQFQLDRTKIVAPFDGVIVSGDLSQSLGAPLEKGQVMFQIAPLDAYRVILKIDERAINEVHAGQQGRLVLSSLPGEKLPFSVENITPVSLSEEGQNFFRVEAKLTNVSTALRPGMEGVGKVEIGSRKLIWIWTHEIVDWLRLWMWSWW